MSIAKKGDKVKVHYVGKLEDGTLFDSSENQDPLEFTLGDKQIIPGFNQGIEGMQVNEKKTIRIPDHEAYGAVRQELIFKVPRDQLPADLEPKQGMQLQVSGQDGEKFPVLIKEALDQEITLDANHPLAGKDLIFELELIEIG